jgi:D-tyrosyl-tRNA(Tyr) deacylase
MRTVIQRVKQARVTVDGLEIGTIGQGIVALLGVHTHDGPDQAAWTAAKIAGLRIFADDSGKMNLDVREAGGSVLAISQFTLLGSCEKGRRPSFVAAASPEHAEPLYERVILELKALGIPVATGRFRADMLVELTNDGPVTLILDSPPTSTHTN